MWSFDIQVDDYANFFLSLVKKLCKNHAANSEELTDKVRQSLGELSLPSIEDELFNKNSEEASQRSIFTTVVFGNLRLSKNENLDRSIKRQLKKVKNDFDNAAYNSYTKVIKDIDSIFQEAFKVGDTFVHFHCSSYWWS